MLWDDSVGATVAAVVTVLLVVVAVVVGLDEDDVCRFLFTMLDCNQLGFYFFGRGGGRGASAKDGDWQGVKGGRHTGDRRRSRVIRRSMFAAVDRGRE